VDVNVTIQSVTVQMAPEALQATLTAISSALQGITMNQQDLAIALNAANTALAGVGDQLTKATAEIVAALAAVGVTTPEVDAAVAQLQTISGALAQAVQQLDDLNPDAA
jgi:ABC-type transporter Mla subunit MlaD